MNEISYRWDRCICISYNVVLEKSKNPVKLFMAHTCLARMELLYTYNIRVFYNPIMLCNNRYFIKISPS